MMSSWLPSVKARNRQGSRARSEEYDEEVIAGTMIGSVHAVDDIEYDPALDPPRYEGRKVRLGFHPPKEAYQDEC